MAARGKLWLCREVIKKIISEKLQKNKIITVATKAHPCLPDELVLVSYESEHEGLPTNARIEFNV